MRKPTPAMSQYLAVKKEYPDKVIFFRMGDFYEMFFGDAKIAHDVLGIALTTRGEHLNEKIPLAGFPYHALDQYLDKMVSAGKQVVICEQVEDPKLAKGVVKREVVEVVSAGTALTEGAFSSQDNRFLVALVPDDDQVAIAWADITTGELTVSILPKESVDDRLIAIGPAEIIFPTSTGQTFGSSLTGLDPIITSLDDWIFAGDHTEEILKKHFNVLSLKGFGLDGSVSAVSAAGATLFYLQEHQKRDLTHIQSLNIERQEEGMILDAPTRRNLELAEPMSVSGGRDATLLGVLDQTSTPMGRRLLRRWLERPLVDVYDINRRLDAVELMVNDRGLRTETAKVLSQLTDLERSVARISMNRANGRDLQALRHSLEKLPVLQDLLPQNDHGLLGELRHRLVLLPEVIKDIAETLVDSPPISIRDGGLIRDGVNSELDELNEIAHSGKGWIHSQQEKERNRTGIPSLKIGFNKVFGFYIEVTKTHQDKVPPEYIRKQTLINAERYITPELKEMESRVLGAEEKIKNIEVQIFEDLRQRVTKRSGDIQIDAGVVAVLDVLVNFAIVATQEDFSRPEVGEDESIILTDSRHPVVEKLLPPGEKFVPNDLEIDRNENRFLLVTGPNMAGKSTYLRQIGLIVLMAQTGCFVPCKSAQIGIVDRIFTRVGAQDNLAGGESTFLMEMHEAANILNNATPKSLILLDEIGRGTSTFDGLSLAWAIVEHLETDPKLQARSLFATHYHELTELAQLFEGVQNLNVAVKQWGDEISFLRKIIPGSAGASYGIQVARLAGLPLDVIERAKEILSDLEEKELMPSRRNIRGRRSDSTEAESENQLHLFIREISQVEESLKKIDPDQLTPLEALQWVIEQKKKLEKPS
ncbi:DNA mismatch repair protein MutS [candidate division LCP-89 bacterium B3_LCP]|uniref:DNA mismatch repair protein MutS n=1 Tax=candidate division LCP-89 bacterium B3_LCP TaxID=2012998 RepID=A0A532UZ82_UNCL8|nr:MAG: DNA mismatch repair protein MutS [candidate division LCP-89 bacterium B3_LCP]